MFINADAEDPEYTGKCPTFYEATQYDHGHGFRGSILNPTNETTRGRWGIIVCSKDKSGRYYPLDANILTYTLPGRQGLNVEIYTWADGFEYHSDHWQDTTIKKDLWLLRVNLNSDEDYQEMLSFADQYLSTGTAADKNFSDDGWDAIYLGRNKAYTSDTSASSDWLYANFGGALK